MGKKGSERKKSEEKSWARSAGEVGEWAYKQVTKEEKKKARDTYVK